MDGCSGFERGCHLSVQSAVAERRENFMKQCMCSACE